MGGDTVASSDSGDVVMASSGAVVLVGAGDSVVVVVSMASVVVTVATEDDCTDVGGSVVGVVVWVATEDGGSVAVFSSFPELGLPKTTGTTKEGESLETLLLLLVRVLTCDSAGGTEGDSVVVSSDVVASSSDHNPRR